MRIDLDDDIIMPFIVGVSAIIITIMHSFYITKSEHNQIIENLVNEADNGFQETAMANKEINDLTKELQSYRTTASQLESLGASHTQAVQVMKAADAYNIDPKS
jgi:uncharacterized protein YxeA